MSSRIKGITIEIGGDTTNLQSALKDVEKKSAGVNKELRDTERLLKLDPGNVELIRQKQDLLSKSIENTKEKLDKLKTAREQMQVAFDKGKVSEETFNKLKREIVATETELEKFNKQLNAMSKNERLLGGLKKELKEIDGALKFDPQNTELVEQKLANLEKQMELTGKEAKELSDELDKIQKNNKGDYNESDINKLKRALSLTTKEYQSLGKQIESTKKEIGDYSTENARLKTLLNGLGKDIKDFSDVLGSKLVRAIDDGSAKSTDLKEAIGKIGNAAIGARVDIKDLVVMLDKIKTTGTGNVSEELKQMANEATNADRKIDDLASKMLDLNKLSGLKDGAELIGNAADKLKGGVQKMLEEGSTQAKLEIRLGLDEEGTDEARSALTTISAHGHSSSEAIEALGRQFKINKDMSTKANLDVVKTASALASVYEGIDLTELIQENNEIAKTLRISNEEALGLVNGLLDAGLPPEELDIVSEYATQLSASGYNATEIQAIFAAGLATGTWNIDNLLDGIKEGRVKMSEFGEEITPAMAELLNKADLSTEKFQALGKDIAEGGEKGKKAMEEVAKQLDGVEDKTLQNALGVAIYGTKWEDQGTNILKTILGISDKTASASENQKKLNSTITAVNSDPMIKFNEALGKMAEALIPLMEPLTEVVKAVADWIAKNPELATGLGSVMFVLKPLVELAAGLGVSIATIGKSAGALKGLSGAGAAGTGVAGTGAGALVGAGLVGVAAVGTGLVIKDGYDKAKAAGDELERATERANEAHLKAVVRQRQFKEEMDEVYKEIEKSTGLTFDEIYNTINNKTKEAAAAGSANAKTLNDNSVAELEKTLTAANFNYDKIKFDISLRSKETETESTKNFKGMYEAASYFLKKTKESAASESKDAKDEIEKNAKASEKTSTKAFSDIEASAKKHMPEAARSAKNAFNSLPNDLEKEAFNLIKEKTSTFLNSLKQMFERFKPKVPAISIVTRQITQYEQRSASPSGTTKHSHKDGLDYVPFDGYIAKLHKGERVLTAAEASVYNSGIGYRDDILAPNTLQHSFDTRSGQSSVEHVHSGTIRVEGYKDGQLDDIREIIVDEFRRGERL